MSLRNNIFNIKNDFERIFFKNEFKLLAGKNNFTLYTIIGIIFLGLVATSFSLGSIEDLQDKMNNPYTNWVDLPVSSSQISGHAEKLLEAYEDKPYIRNISSYRTPFFQFYHTDFDLSYNYDTLLYQLKGRTVGEEDSLLIKAILQQKNLDIRKNEQADFFQNSFLSKDEIILTKEMSVRLGINEQDPIDKVMIRDGVDEFLFLRIAAIVDCQLPNHASYLISPQLYNVLTVKIVNTKRCYNDFIERGMKKRQFTFFSADNQQVKKQFNAFFGGLGRYYSEGSITTGNKTWEIGKLSFLPAEQIEQDTIKEFIAAQQVTGVPIAQYNIFKQNVDGCEFLGVSPHFLAFNFRDLSKVEQFQQEIKEEYDITINLSQIEAKSNFSSVASMTWGLLTILVLFTVLCLGLFIYNLLRAHLIQIKPNLGTFMAFGLNVQFLKNVYSRIVLHFIFKALIVATILLTILWLLNTYFFKSDYQLIIFNEWLLVPAIGFVLVGVFITRIMMNKIIFEDTPGDLIYGRE